jgi:hypothetical protein
MIVVSSLLSCLAAPLADYRVHPFVVAADSLIVHVVDIAAGQIGRRLVSLALTSKTDSTRRPDRPPVFNARDKLSGTGTAFATRALRRFSLDPAEFT